jgi:single-stranded DNA-binding protein
VSTTIKKGSHVLVEGSLVSTTYERANGKGKKANTNKQTFWDMAGRDTPVRLSFLGGKGS